MSTVISSRTSALLSRLFLNNSRRAFTPSSTTASPTSAARRLHEAHPPRILRSFFTKRLQSSSSSHQAKKAAKEAVASPGLRARLTKLMRENGWVAVGIYTALSVLDFGLSFLVVSAVGAEVMQKGERWVWAKLGYPSQEQPGTEEEHKTVDAASNVWTRAALAYGVHKTALLPLRVGLTAWITPATVRLLRSYGYKVGPGVTSKVASKTAEGAAKKAP